MPDYKIVKATEQGDLLSWYPQNGHAATKILIRLLRNSEIVDNCLEWCGDRSPKQQGKITLDNRRLIVSRVAYALLVDKFEQAEHVLHTCDNPPCWLPEHLFLGTNYDNVQDMLRKDRQAKGQNHGRASLTDVQAIRIVTLSKQGMRGVDIAKLMNLEYSQVKDIAGGRSWRHLRA